MIWTRIRRRLLGDIEERVSRLEQIIDDKYSTLLGMTMNLEKRVDELQLKYYTVHGGIRDLKERVERLEKQHLAEENASGSVNKPPCIEG